MKQQNYLVLTGQITEPLQFRSGENSEGKPWASQDFIFKFGERQSMVIRVKNGNLNTSAPLITESIENGTLLTLFIDCTATLSTNKNWFNTLTAFKIEKYVEQQPAQPVQAVQPVHQQQQVQPQQTVYTGIQTKR